MKNKQALVIKAQEEEIKSVKPPEITKMARNTRPRYLDSYIRNRSDSTSRRH
jgi:hypothetical protein